MPRRYYRLRDYSRSFPRLLSCLSLGLALSASEVPASPHAPASSDSPRSGAPGMPAPHTGSILVDYYESFLRDHDIDAFRQNVSARYNEGTLIRLLHSRDARA